MQLTAEAGCSSGLNPLNNLSKHTQRDNTFFRDHLVANTPFSISQSWRSIDSEHQRKVQESFDEFNRSSSMQNLGFDPDQALLAPTQNYLQRPNPQQEWTSEFWMKSSNAIPLYPTAQGDSYDVFNKPTKFYEPSEGPFVGSSMPLAKSLRHRQSPWTMGHRFEHRTLHNSQSNTAPIDMAVAAPVASDQQWDSVFSQMEASLETTTLHTQTTEKSVDEIVRSVVQVSLEEDKLWMQLDDTQSVTGVYPNMQVSDEKPIYAFSSENDFRSHPSPFEEGLHILSDGGNLSLAILAFEAACQQDPSHVEAWRMLGSTQADNADEVAAMHALEEAQRLEPNNLEILMGLAIAFTNNGFDGKAYQMLENWIQIKYPEVSEAAPPLDDYKFHSHHTQLQHVKELFLTAARMPPVDEQIDTEVQVGLGVLLFSGESYQMAADCFHTALTYHPNPGLGNNTQQDLHLLWNRLGAAMANMGRYDEAIEHYNMALAVNTNFVRAHHNLAVLYHNTNRYTKAAEHALEALGRQKAPVSRTAQKKQVKNLHVNSAGREEFHSNELYEVLRKVLRQINRWDLVPGVGVDMDISAYKSMII